MVWVIQRLSSLRSHSPVGVAQLWIVIFMRLMPSSPFAKGAIGVLLLLMSAALSAWFGFRQGERQMAGPLAVRMANDSCFDCWAGLSALKDTNKANLAILL